MDRDKQGAVFVKTPPPPYYAVIFTSLRRKGDDGYAEMAQKMADLAALQPGCLGVESVRDADGFGLTVSYFASESAILAWKAQAEHLLAQALGQTFAGMSIMRSASPGWSAPMAARKAATSSPEV